MSDDFIILQCPNCGSSLRIGRNVTEYKCESCGVEHLGRQTAAGVTVEAHARCPVCNKNDRVEKVSSTLNRQVKKTESALAKLLMPPKPPQLDPRSGPGKGTINWASCSSIPLFLLAAWILLLFFNLALNFESPSYVSAPIAFIFNILFGVVIAGVPFGIGLLLLKRGTLNWASYNSILLLLLSAAMLFFFVSGIVRYTYEPNVQNLIMRLFVNLILLGMPAGTGLLLQKKVAPKVQAKIQEKIDARNEAEAERISTSNADIERQKQDWEKAMYRYRKLYYCQRDEVVFVPGETESVPADRMNDLLFK